MDAEHGALNFRPVDRAHHGAYTCVAINDVGRYESEGQLDVVGASSNHTELFLTLSEIVPLLCE